MRAKIKTPASVGYDWLLMNNAVSQTDPCVRKGWVILNLIDPPMIGLSRTMIGLLLQADEHVSNIRVDHTPHLNSHNTDKAE